MSWAPGMCWAVVRVDGRDHDIVSAVDHQGRLGDRLELGERLTVRELPIDDRGRLRLHCLLGRRRVDVGGGALVATLPEPFSGGLAGRRGLKEEPEVFERQYFVPRGDMVHVGVAVRVVAGAGLGAGENEPAHEFAVAEREGLRDIAADGEAEDVDAGQTQRADECSGVVRLRFHGVRGLAGGACDAGVVEQDDRTGCRRPVRR